MNTETDDYIDNGSQGTGMRREKYMEVKCAINSRVRIGLFIQVNGLDRLYFIMLICQFNHGDHENMQ